MYCQVLCSLYFCVLAYQTMSQCLSVSVSQCLSVVILTCVLYVACAQVQYAAHDAAVGADIFMAMMEYIHKFGLSRQELLRLLATCVDTKQMSPDQFVSFQSCPPRD